ncbi:hypothetical protein SAMN05192548_103619 [Paraburkholderia terricola]|uniref:Uncharacterized protein n=1 Tax=Paraburkholderia terricola TaxID=169427 RepID=A0A1M6V0B2_9BURK|nr:hypothetical protein SAMN05192547_103323 [Paraburkholderia sediminicola]SHK74746.1 hypothetical protein SAMN05192548_103619 [Paraburkholderia terricola]
MSTGATQSGHSADVLCLVIVVRLFVWHLIRQIELLIDLDYKTA